MKKNTYMCSRKKERKRKKDRLISGRNTTGIAGIIVVVVMCM